MQNEKPVETWFKMEIRTGIELFQRLRIPFYPRTLEETDVVVDAWLTVLWPGSVWVSTKHAPSFRNAFRQMGKRGWNNFPLPSDFLDALKSFPVEQGLLEYPDLTGDAKVRADAARKRFFERFPTAGRMIEKLQEEV